MRVVFSSAPGHGHLLPMMPLARAFQKAGHSVGMLTAEPMRSLIEPEGFDMLAAGPSAAEVVADIHRRTGVDLMTEVTPESELDFFAGTRVDLAAAQAIDVTLNWKPDLVVSEMADFVGPLAAGALAVPRATLSYGTRRPDQRTAELEELAASRYKAHGIVAAPPVCYLDTCPPTLNYPGWQPPVVRLLLRPEPYRQPWAASSSLVPDRGVRPRVLVSFGTVFSQPGLLSPLLRGLVAADVDVVSTLGLTASQSDFDVDRTRVWFAPFVPLAELLWGVDVIVTHGGAGTTLAALARGIPLVIVPQGADQPRQAERVVAVGAGVALNEDAATPVAVADAVLRCLHDKGIRDAALRMSQEIARMPAPEAVVNSLVQTGRRS